MTTSAPTRLLNHSSVKHVLAGRGQGSIHDRRCCPVKNRPLTLSCGPHLKVSSLPISCKARLIRSRLTLVSPFGLRYAQSDSQPAMLLGSRSPAQPSPRKARLQVSCKTIPGAAPHAARLPISQSPVNQSPQSALPSPPPFWHTTSVILAKNAAVKHFHPGLQRISRECSSG